MEKIFVSLDSETSPKMDPYQIMNWVPNLNENQEKTKRAKQKNTKSSCLKTQIQRKNQKDVEAKIKNEFFGTNQPYDTKIEFKKELKPRCVKYDRHTECIKVCRTIEQLKWNAETREKILKYKEEINHNIHNVEDINPDKVETKQELIRFDSPVFVGDIKPKSRVSNTKLEVVYVPSRKLLDIKKAKSGIYINEENIDMDTTIPFDTYNPRLLQSKFDSTYPKFDVFNQNNGLQVLIQENEEFCQQRQDFSKTIKSSTNMNPEEIITKMIKLPRKLYLDFNPEVIQGNVCVERSSLDSENRKFQEIACIFAAYAYTFVTPIEDWDDDTIDDIITKGQELHEASLGYSYVNENSCFDTLPHLDIDDIPISLKLSEPYFKGTLKNPTTNIYKCLLLHFLKYDTCIFHSRDVFFLIWRKCNSFYIFDPNGRSKLNFTKQDYTEDGVSSFMKIQNLQHVCYVILNLSNLEESDIFNLYELQLIKFGGDEINYQQFVKPKIPKKFVTVNRNYAIIYGKLGLTPLEDIEINPSLFICYFSLIYKEIEPPTRWYKQVIDQLIKYGVEFHVKYLKKNKFNYFNVTNLPYKIRFGTFQATIERKDFYKSGHIYPCEQPQLSELVKALNAFFKIENAALVQIDSTTMAIWHDIRFYYVFDPFQRGPIGEFVDPDEDGFSCLQFHTNIDSMLKTLHKNSLDIMVNGNFFIHSIIIKKLENVNFSRFVKEKTQYNALKLEYPNSCEQNKNVFKNISTISSIRNNETSQAASSSVFNHVPEKCLSLLSIAPCERTCSETSVYEKEQQEKALIRKKEKLLNTTDSLESLTPSVKELATDVYDPIDGVLENDLFNALIAEGSIQQPKIIKHRETDIIKAKKVLLKSDRGYLEKLIKDVNHNKDYDNWYETFKTYPYLNKNLTIDEELQIQTNFIDLPGGNWIVSGTENIVVDKLKNNYISGVLSSLLSHVFMKMYSIITWNDSLIDYIIKTSRNIEETLEISEKDFLTFLLKANFPKLQLGSQTFSLNIKKIESGTISDIHSLVRNCLEQMESVLILFNDHSCSIFKYHNFFYLFNGYPSNNLGFRLKTSGVSCLLRFVDLRSVLQRIDFNRLNSNNEQNMVILSVNVKPVENDDNDTMVNATFLNRTPSSDSRLLNKEKEELVIKDKNKDDKINFLKSEIDQEIIRIDEFLKEKEENEAAKRNIISETEDQADRKDDQAEDAEDWNEVEENPDENDGEKETEDDEDRERGGQETGDEENRERGGQETSQDGNEEETQEKADDKEQEPTEDIPFKHEPKKDYTTEKIKKSKKKNISKTGYKLRNNNFLYKIQGTTALSDRTVESKKLVRDCYFTSMYAILYAIHRPLEKWESNVIDMILEKAKELAENIEDKTTACKRKITKLIIDDYIYDINVRVNKILANIVPPSVDFAIEQIAKDKKYFLLQFTNVTFGISKDKNSYHLFDSYKTLEKVVKEKKNETVKPPPKNIPVYRDANTASWIVFPDIKTMMEYIEDRVTSPKWKNQYKLHIIDILSFKKVSEKERAKRLLQAATEKTIANNRKEDLQAEKMSWFEDLPELVPWSRLYLVNLVKEVRGSVPAKWKDYDIEIPNQLYSLWGGIHPDAPVFEKYRGKQYLAVNVMACCMATTYPITEWNSHVLDSIVVNGDAYLEESISDIKTEYEISLENLNTQYTLYKSIINIHLESVIYGKLFNTKTYEVNLSRALQYVFQFYKYGIIQCLQKSLAFGRCNDEGYFVFDCQSYGNPLFQENQGSSYILRCMSFQQLLYCIILTLNIPYYNIEFVVHGVEASVEGDNNEENNESEPEDSDEVAQSDVGNEIQKDEIQQKPVQKAVPEPTPVTEQNDEAEQDDE